MQTFGLWTFKDWNVVISNLVILSEKLELNLQKLDLQRLIELLALHPKELTNEDLIELEAQGKDEEGQEEEVAEKLKRLHNAGNDKGFFFIWGGTVSFGGTGPKRRMVHEVAAIQNVVQCYRVIYDKKKGASIQTLLDHFFKRVDKVESSEEPEPVPSTSMSEIAACPHLLLMITLQLFHLPPPLPPPVSNSSCLFTRSQPLSVSYCTVLIYFSRYCTISLKIMSFLCVFLYYLYESIKNLLQ